MQRPYLGLALSPSSQPSPFPLLVLAKQELARAENKLCPATRGRQAKALIEVCIIFSTKAVLIPVVLFVPSLWWQLGMHWWEARRCLSSGKPCLGSGALSIARQRQLCCIALTPSSCQPSYF